MLTVSDPSLLPLDAFLSLATTDTGDSPLPTRLMRTSSLVLEDDDVTRLRPAIVRISSPSKGSDKVSSSM
jgi:hypothetical protein